MLAVHMTKSRKWSVRTSRVEPSVRQSYVDVSDNECELEDNYGGEDYRRSLFKKVGASFDTQMYSVAQSSAFIINSRLILSYIAD